jgi:cob(I)alamin adenosyltransferase
MDEPAVDHMKVYTGTGDRGKTSLFSGERVTKSDRRIAAYGDVDELNSLLGALTAELNGKNSELLHQLQQIQADLFQLSAILATTPDSPAMDSLEPIAESRVTDLERAIDNMDAQLPALRGFILPGGHPAAAWAHICRTVCRRAERKVTRIEGDYEGGSAAVQFKMTLVYLNRLSDYLFVLARYCNLIQGVSDTLWKQK